MNFILIDGSYFIFHRFYALKLWMKHQKDVPDNIELYENDIFVEKFKETFISKINEIQKKLKIKNCIKIVGLDCRRNNLWRSKLFDNYKSNRKNNSVEKKFFEIVFNYKLFEQTDIDHIFKHPNLEADDCLGITTKYLLNKYENSKIWIITSDCDYLQLINDNVIIYDLKYKCLNDKSLGSADCDKFCKIMMGDKSDNIPSVFPKCGIKTALKLYNDKELFNKKVRENETYFKNYNFNKLLIDFDEIPKKLIDEFIKCSLDNISFNYKN
jgi:5'-3' exonuclease